MKSPAFKIKLGFALLFLSFAALLVVDQIARGGRALFEHPSGATSWDQKNLDKLRNRKMLKKLFTTSA